MIDENAFGVLISNLAIEDEEYGLERAEFVDRFTLFRTTLRGLLRERPPGGEARALDLGHALYVELGEGAQTESPITWARAARALLSELGFETVAVVTHGGRWVEEAEPSWLSTEALGAVGLVTASNPSEPLRRALCLDAAARPDDEGGPEGWGPGLYLDVEAVEPLGIKLRNEPTLLRFAGAAFYRIGS